MLVFGILLIHNYFNIDRQEKQIKFDHVLIAFMLYFLVDCFWAAIVAEIIPKNRFTVVTNVFLIYVLMAAITYFWLQYVLAYEQVPNRGKPKFRFAVLFPFILSTAALILNYLIAPDMLINENLDTLPFYNIYLVTVPYIYMAAILFYTLRKAIGEENPAEKRKHIFIGCFTCLILMLIFYIQSIELRISLDPLTNLNNRGQLNHYISQSSSLHQDGRLTIVIMIDIDNFKEINDTYGHAEGDKALIIVSESIKKSVNKHSMPSFIGRYGGDEFIIIIYPATRGETDQLINEIRNEIDVRVKVMDYPLSISAGYDELTGKEDSFQSCIQRADRELYQDKHLRKNRLK